MASKTKTPKAAQTAPKLFYQTSYFYIMLATVFGGIPLLYLAHMALPYIGLTDAQNAEAMAGLMAGWLWLVKATVGGNVFARGAVSITKTVMEAQRKSYSQDKPVDFAGAFLEGLKTALAEAGIGGDLKDNILQKVLAELSGALPGARRDPAIVAGEIASKALKDAGNRAAYPPLSDFSDAGTVGAGELDAEDEETRVVVSGLSAAQI